MTVFLSIAVVLALFMLAGILLALLEISEKISPSSVLLETPRKPLRMPWEGDESTFNVVKRHTDDGMG